MSKSCLNELAILGGQPAFKVPLHVGTPNIGNREKLRQRIDDILDRRWLTNNGPYVRELERRIVDKVGVRHCVATCNGTLALEIAIRALGLSGEVIVPSFTFVATAHALQWQEITPVFADVDPHTHTLNPDEVERMVTPRTSGIIGVHLWGRACNTQRLVEIARERNLRLIYDAAHAFGCSHRGRMIGSFGDAEVFSFHATKFLNTFEGGAIVTNNDDLAAKARLMTNFGFVDYDKVIHVGSNGKMCEVAAAMGLTSLESMDAFIATNYQNYKQYQQGLADLPGIRMLTYDETDRCNFQYVVLEMDEAVSGISRDDLVRVLHAEHVLARRYFYPGCHRMEPYRSYAPHAGLLLPVTERLTGRILSLPTGTAIGTAEIDMLCALISFTIRHGAEISKLLHKGAPVALGP